MNVTVTNEWEQALVLAIFYAREKDVGWHLLFPPIIRHSQRVTTIALTIRDVSQARSLVADAQAQLLDAIRQLADQVM